MFLEHMSAALCFMAFIVATGLLVGIGRHGTEQLYRRIKNNINIAVLCFSIGLASGIAGFALGSSNADENGFRFEDWQPLTGSMVALIAAAIAFWAAWRTQQITLLIKDQESVGSRLLGFTELSKQFGWIKYRFESEAPLAYAQEVLHVEFKIDRYNIRRIVPNANDEVVVTARKLVAPLTRAKEYADQLRRLQEIEDDYNSIACTVAAASWKASQTEAQVAERRGHIELVKSLFDERVAAFIKEVQYVEHRVEQLTRAKKSIDATLDSYYRRH